MRSRFGSLRVQGLLAATILVVATGCVDPLVNRPTALSERWSGQAEAIAASIESPCGPVAFELFRDGLAIGGTAREGLAGEHATSSWRRWWVEGTVNPNGTFLFSLRQQGPLFVEGPRPSSVWRGSFAGGEAVAIEQPPACGRRVQLVREREAGSPS